MPYGSLDTCSNRLGAPFGSRSDTEGRIFLSLDTVDVDIDIFGTSTVSGLGGSSLVSIEFFFCQELIYFWTPLGTGVGRNLIREPQKQVILAACLTL